MAKETANVGSPAFTPTWLYLVIELRPGEDPDPIGLYSSEDAAEAAVNWRGAEELVECTSEGSRWDREWLDDNGVRPVRLVLTRLRVE